jgi:predicted short-subunit dehydrogenase-like oxidoreductase (DUF2520 family)
VNARSKALGFIGAGKLGSALAVKLADAGYNVAVVADLETSAAARLAGSIEGCRPAPTAQSAAEEADLVFITTSDDAIGSVCRLVRWKTGQAVVHCSGADSTDILTPAAEQGAQIGSFHPCQAFVSGAYAVKNISGSTFAIEADQPLAGILEDMAGDLACEHILLSPSDKPLYHAAAVFVSNYVVTLLKAGTDLFSEMGISPDRAVKILMPLMKGNLSNIELTGLPGCLTGPIARGDSGTVEKHIRTLRERSPGYLQLYAELGIQTVSIAKEKGSISRATAFVLTGILEDALLNKP